MRLVAFLLPLACWADVVLLDTSGVKPGPILVQAGPESVVVTWPDESDRAWRAEFSLNPAKPLITSIGVAGKVVVDRARPLYWVETGKRRGGWDQFFDFPPSHPDGTRRYTGEFRLQRAKARTVGDRVELHFDGLAMGIFTGGIAYTFYPGCRLIQQEAVASTSEPDTAYFYDTGLRMRAEADLRPGGNMEARLSYYGTDGEFREVAGQGPDRTPMAVRYRALAARTANGSVVVFPPPHRYFFARDFTTNQGYLWHSAWRGDLSIGVRQWPDDNTRFYPWMNAPPGSVQRMGIFLLVSDHEMQATLDEVLRFTNRDRLPALPGYKAVTAHWHFAYTVQAMAKGFGWTPPFKPVLKAMGVDAGIIADFHGDGHARDLTELRLKELEAYFQACRAQSDPEFLLIPSEEANVHLGGHWAVAFSRPVYWFMDRPAGSEFATRDPKYGTVYRVGNEQDMLELARRENGLMYQTHPRTKGSTGYPDKIRDTAHFLDPHYFGAGWKAMPSDLSSPRLGERALKLLDDMANWGLKKKLLGEVDVFQIDPTHELYAHMNVNYVQFGRLPEWNGYGKVLEALNGRSFFVTTGEVLLPEVRISASSDRVSVAARLRWTFPLQLAEIVWGDGAQTQRKLIPIEETRPFGSSTFRWTAEALGWKWARLAVWDVAGNGAFTNPVWR